MGKENLFYWIIGVIIIPIILVFWQIRQNKKIAIKTGSLKRPILELNFMFDYFRVDTVIDVFIGIDLNKNYNFFLLRIPMFFNNKGDKTLEEVIYKIEFPATSSLFFETLTVEGGSLSRDNSSIE